MPQNSKFILEKLSRDGYCKFEDKVFSEADFSRLKFLVYEIVKKNGLQNSQIITPILLHCPLLLKWLFSKRMLDLVESIIGPNIVFTSGSVFYKSPKSKEVTYWHHDRHSYTKTPPLMENTNSVYNFIISLDHIEANSGAIQYIPGSQNINYIQETDVRDNSFFKREVPYSVILHENDLQKATALELKENEASVHCMGVVHGSSENKSEKGRCLISVKFCSADFKIYKENFYIPPYLVRGTDTAGSGLTRL